MFAVHIILFVIQSKAGGTPVILFYQKSDFNAKDGCSESDLTSHLFQVLGSHKHLTIARTEVLNHNNTEIFLYLFDNLEKQVDTLRQVPVHINFCQGMTGSLVTECFQSSLWKKADSRFHSYEM